MKFCLLKVLFFEEIGKINEWPSAKSSQVIFRDPINIDFFFIRKIRWLKSCLCKIIERCMRVSFISTYFVKVKRLLKRSIRISKISLVKLSSRKCAILPTMEKISHNWSVIFSSNFCYKASTFTRMLLLTHSCVYFSSLNLQT